MDSPICFVLGTVSLGGALGGLGAIAAQLEFRNGSLLREGDQIDTGDAVLYLISSTFIGIVGGNAVLFVLVALRSFPNVQGLEGTPSPENFFYLWSISIIAGFAARRMLKGLADQLLDRVRSEMKARAEEQNEEFQKQLGEERAARETADKKADLRSRAFEAMDEANPQLRQNIIARIERFLEANGPDRELMLPLGRLLKLEGRYQHGIEWMTRLIDHARNLKGAEKLYGDALYNRACYKALEFGNSPSEELRKSALHDLEMSIRIDPDNEKFAIGEEAEDFKAIKDDAEFRRLTGGA
jgi:tetratricopeptide (TPR) repeat protein